LSESGYKKQVKQTLQYALSCYRKHGRIQTTISKNGIPFDFPYYAVDSLPYMLYCLSVLDDRSLVDEFQDFLEKEIRYFCDKVVAEDGLVRRDKRFSSMKDHSKRSSSCYGNSMLYLMQEACNKLALMNPLAKYDYTRMIVEKFWKKDHFIDDMSSDETIAGDANIFPFWTGAVKNKEKLRKAVEKMRNAGLDKPFPLRYTSTRKKSKRYIFLESLVKNYEGNTIWMHMGPLYISLVGKVDKTMQKSYLKKYEELMLKHGNYLEVFNPDGAPFNSFLYYSDESMIWCANLLKMLEGK
jgi:hypothetical protein